MGAEVREIGDVVADSRRLGSPRGRKSGWESICNHPRRRHALGSLTLTTRPVAICLSGSWCALVYPFPATSVIQYVPSPGDVRPPHLRRPLLCSVELWPTGSFTRAGRISLRQPVVSGFHALLLSGRLSSLRFYEYTHNVAHEPDHSLT